MRMPTMPSRIAVIGSRRNGRRQAAAMRAVTSESVAPPGSVTVPPPDQVPAMPANGPKAPHIRFCRAIASE